MKKKFFLLVLILGVSASVVGQFTPSIVGDSLIVIRHTKFGNYYNEIDTMKPYYGVSSKIKKIWETDPSKITILINQGIVELSDSTYIILDKKNKKARWLSKKELISLKKQSQIIMTIFCTLAIIIIFAIIFLFIKICKSKKYRK